MSTSSETEPYHLVLVCPQRRKLILAGKTRLSPFFFFLSQHSEGSKTPPHPQPDEGEDGRRLRNASANRNLLPSSPSSGCGWGGVFDPSECWERKKKKGERRVFPARINFRRCGHTNTK